MRKLYTFALSILLLSCLSESNVDPGSSSTFIRYYNGGNNDEAKALELGPNDGYALLATTQIKKSDADKAKFKIKLIDTDSKGNPIGTALYPEYKFYTPNGTTTPVDTSRDYQAASIQRITTGAGGYVIVGDYIQSNDTLSLLLVVDKDRKVVDEKTFNYGRGRAVAITSDGDFLMLTIKGKTNMYLLEIDKDTRVAKTITPYPAGQTTIASRLLIDETDKAIWSGVVTNSGLTGIRVLKTIPSNINTEFDRLVSQPGFDLVGKDICKFGLDYAVIGSTNHKPGATAKSPDTDILFVRMNPLGDTLSTRSYPFGTADNQNDVGNSISSTSDGGLILLSSVSSVAINGRGDNDFYLIRIDAFGNTVWTSSFGSKFKDEGVAIRQSSDGGYVVFGTTTQGQLKILALLKSDTNGKID